MTHPTRERLRILTWHVHGNYLYYLSQVPHDFYLVTRPPDASGRVPPGYAGKVGVLPWGDNVHEVPFDAVAGQHFDAVLYQSRAQWEDDRLSVLSAAQRRCRRSISNTIRRRNTPPIHGTGCKTRTCCWCM